MTDLEIRRLVAVGFEVVPVAVGWRTMYRCVHIDLGDVGGEPHAEEMDAWAAAACAAASYRPNV